MPSPQEARIIGPSQIDISRANTTFKEVVSGRRLLARSHGLPRWTYPLLVAGSTLLAIACGTPKVAEPTPKAAVSITTEVTPPAAAGASPSPEPPRPTATAEPARATATAAPVGGPEAINLGNEALNRIADDLANNRPVAESDIIRFNAALEEKRKADEAAQAATKPAATPAPATPEAEINSNVCTFISNPELCNKGRPLTRQGRENMILYIDYENLPPGTPLNGIMGTFKTTVDPNNNPAGFIIEIGGPNELSMEVISTDLVIDNKKIRDITTAKEIIAKVGQSGKVRFTASAKNPATGNFTVPQDFFTQYFPAEVLNKPKELTAIQSQIVIVKKFE